MNGRLELERFRGIIPALITPYTAEEQIDGRTARNLVRHLMDKRVAGFFLNGSTGEGFLQTVGERKQFLEIVLNEVAGAVPVIAHIGAMDTATCVELAKHAALAGADAISAVAPFYYKHGAEQLRRHYLDIARATDLPFIIYHFPAFTGVGADVQFYRQLAEIENIVGVKFTSKDTFELQQLIEACGDEFLVFNGPDECLLAGLVMGCCGAIGSTYNIMPGKFVELFESFARGDLPAARAIQREVNAVIAELTKYDFIAFEREILRLQGFDVGQARRPIQRLTDEERGRIHRFAERHAFLETAR